jgi:parallel beta-helix repeat protein
LEKEIQGGTMTKTLGIGPGTALAAAIAILAGLSGQQLLASTVAVGGCVPNVVHFPTIQAAVNAVSAGSTIEVCPGNYPEQVVINKKLSLLGINSGTAFDPVLVEPASGFAANTTSLTSGHPIAAQILVASPATAVTINNLAVDGAGNNLNSGCGDTRLIGIYYQNASGTLNHIVARNQAQDEANFGCADSAGLGIFVQSASPSTSTVTIENSSIHGYQKNGITANETGTTVTVNGNSVVGSGPIAVAQNGIQVGYGGTGSVVNNRVADDISSEVSSEGRGSGVLIYGSGNMTITGNSVANTQNGIAIMTDGGLTADDNTISNNVVSDTHLGDGIDLCSNHNSVISNIVYSSGEAGIHLDGGCGATGNNNTVSNNSVIEACAGVLLGSGTGNSFPAVNPVANVTYTSLAGDVCTPTLLLAAPLRGQVSSPGNSSRPARP